MDPFWVDTAALAEASNENQSSSSAEQGLFRNVLQFQNIQFCMQLSTRTYSGRGLVFVFESEQGVSVEKINQMKWESKDFKPL